MTNVGGMPRCNSGNAAKDIICMSEFMVREKKQGKSGGRKQISRSRKNTTRPINEFSLVAGYEINV